MLNIVEILYHVVHIELRFKDCFIVELDKT